MARYEQTITISSPSPIGSIETVEWQRFRKNSYNDELDGGGPFLVTYIDLYNLDDMPICDVSEFIHPLGSFDIELDSDARFKVIYYARLPEPVNSLAYRLRKIERRRRREEEKTKTKVLTIQHSE